MVDKYAEHPDQIDLSPYVYVADNPIDKTDPDGNCPDPPCNVSAQIQLAPVIAEGAEALVVAGATALGMYGLHAILSNPGNGIGRPVMQRDAIAPTPPIVQSSKSTNHLKPDASAGGDHSTFKIDKNGKITGTATYEKNPKNPSGFQEKKRVDVTGGDHGGVPTPHVHEDGKVRPAGPDDLPRQTPPPPPPPAPKPQTPPNTPTSN